MLVTEYIKGYVHGGITLFLLFDIAIESQKMHSAWQAPVSIPEACTETLTVDCGALADVSTTIRGDLARPWRMRDRPYWSLSQILSILNQCLRGLASLHASPNPVIHRDIKPQNILVEYREGLVEPREPEPWIKLADFGEAVQGTECNGQAGTREYAAPETFTGQAYDSKADVWSLGVVILQLIGEGRLPTPTNGRMHGPQWCQDIITFVDEKTNICSHQDASQLGNDRFSMETTLWGFIALCMLKMRPKDRMSAQQCLDSPILIGLHEYARALARGPPNSAQQSQILYANQTRGRGC